MARDGRVIEPDPRRRAHYDRDYRVFLAMHEQRRALDRIVASGPGARAAGAGG
jgi:hypothetical protein